MMASENIGALSGQELPEKQARLALALAVAVHLALFLAGVLSPYLINRRPLLPDIYTVNLIAVNEPAPASPRHRRAAAPARAITAPPVKKAAPAVAKQPAPKPAAKPAPATEPAPAAKPDAVSLRPIRRRTSRDLKAVDAIRRQLHTQEVAVKARQNAKKAVSSALAAIRDSLHTEDAPVVTPSGASATAKSAATGSGGPAGTAVVDEAKRRYFAEVYQRIKEHFVLPDLKNWQPTLQAVLVIEVRRDGIVTHSSFEKKSENIFFNQAVEKALAEAAPMPPFPPELKDSSLEFGLRFRPGDLL